MAKTLKSITKELHNVDCVCEILDARIPYSSQNPNLSQIITRKPKFYVLSKADLADEKTTRQWISYLHSEGSDAFALDCRDSQNRKKLKKALDIFISENVRRKTEARPRIMFVGVPNVGKSSVINLLAGQKAAKVEDRPGVTRGKQWLDSDTFQLMDMPGVLWPKFENDKVAFNLAYTGAIKDDVFDIEEIASSLMAEIASIQPEVVREKVCPEFEGMSGYELMEAYGRKRGFLVRGGEVDDLRAAKAVLTDMRNAKFGRISLEAPGDL